MIEVFAGRLLEQVCCIGSSLERTIQFLDEVAVVTGRDPVQERAGDPMLGALVGGLTARQMLVVLDNCEQVADAVAETCERLLADCDDLWILATSTRALKVQGEARLRVSPLPVPAAGESFAEVVASEAVALFVERASAVDPDFALTAGTEESVAEIVRRLDGMPLAVELAAARVSALGIAELLAGLDDRFTVLVENNRGAPVRQQSLLAALDCLPAMGLSQILMSRLNFSIHWPRCSLIFFQSWKTKRLFMSSWSRASARAISPPIFTRVLVGTMR